MLPLAAPRPVALITPLAKAALAALATLAAPGAPLSAQHAPPSAQHATREARGHVAPPTELFEVVKVVDGDTIHIQRNGKRVKLRLLSVDTEEVIYNRDQWRRDGSKPQTVYGTETALWARRFFEEQADGDDELARVGLRFPRGIERLDVYGRLLCHVVMPDGTDFNLHLVETGKSPYFNKYGNSLIAHDAFVAAQASARAQQLGIWSPSVNEPASPAAPSAKRPYESLLPWWQVRADAVESYRAIAAATPDAVANAEEPETLDRAARSGKQVRVFGTIERFFDEDDDSQTVLFRSGDKSRAFRARVPADKRGAIAKLGLERTQEDFRQNYLWVRGTVAPGRGYEMQAGDPAQWELAGPDPPRAAPAAGRTTTDG